MLVSDAERGELIAYARKLATQARDKVPHYQHSETACPLGIGYNYRLSNPAGTLCVGGYCTGAVGGIRGASGGAAAEF